MPLQLKDVPSYLLLKDVPSKQQAKHDHAHYISSPTLTHSKKSLPKVQQCLIHYVGLLLTLPYSNVTNIKTTLATHYICITCISVGMGMYYVICGKNFLILTSIDKDYQQL